MEIFPTEIEVLQEVRTTLVHSNHVEYFLTNLGIGDINDPERPHDIYGLFNKYTWDWIRGHALQYRKDPSLEHYIQKPIMLHRDGQMHHRRWNNYNLDATIDDLRSSATDANCSLLEGRQYQGGPYSYGEIAEICRKKSKAHQKKWIQQMIEEMQTIPQPNLGLIRTASMTNFPNIGLPDITYQRIISATENVIKMLKEKGYNITS
nr:hypothetical protein [Nanoarchaeum sp.]